MTSARILALTGKPRGNSMMQGQRQVPADGLHGPARPVRSLRTLWRQAQLTARHGLYEVADGIYQVRGFGTSNMTMVEGDHSVIVIDPMVSARPQPPPSLSTVGTGATGLCQGSHLSIHTPTSTTSAGSWAWSAPTPMSPSSPEHFLENAGEIPRRKPALTATPRT